MTFYSGINAQRKQTPEEISLENQVAKLKNTIIKLKSKINVLQREANDVSYSTSMLKSKQKTT